MLQWGILDLGAQLVLLVSMRSVVANRLGHGVPSYLDLQIGNLYKLVVRCGSGQTIIAALPFAFDFDSVLRRGMTEAEIDPRQRIGSLLLQRNHLHRRLFIGGSVRGAIDAAPVSRLTGCSIEFSGR